MSSLLFAYTYVLSMLCVGQHGKKRNLFLLFTDEICLYLLAKMWRDFAVYIGNCTNNSLGTQLITEWNFVYASHT